MDWVLGLSEDFELELSRELDLIIRRIRRMHSTTVIDTRNLLEQIIKFVLKMSVFEVDVERVDINNINTLLRETTSSGKPYVIITFYIREGGSWLWIATYIVLTEDRTIAYYIDSRIVTLFNRLMGLLPSHDTGHDGISSFVVRGLPKPILNTITIHFLLDATSDLIKINVTAFNGEEFMRASLSNAQEDEVWKLIDEITNFLQSNEPGDNASAN